MATFFYLVLPSSIHKKFLISKQQNLCIPAIKSRHLDRPPNQRMYLRRERILVQEKKLSNLTFRANQFLQRNAPKNSFFFKQENLNHFVEKPASIVVFAKKGNNNISAIADEIPLQYRYRYLRFGTTGRRIPVHFLPSIRIPPRFKQTDNNKNILT